MRKLTIFTLAIIMTTGALAKEKSEKPNILFIAVDDLRTELGCYGVDEIITPNIDRLASEGNVFQNAYCNAAVCGASRASLMTSIYPIPNKRFVNYLARADKEVPDAITLPEYLKSSGYYTLSNGKIFHHKDDSPESWSEPAWQSKGANRAVIKKGGLTWHNPKAIEIQGDSGKKGPFYDAGDVPDNYYRDGKITDKTIEDLQRLAKSDEPFFLAYGLMKPHLPFNAPQKYWDMYEREKIPLADNCYIPHNAPDILKTSKEIMTYSGTDGFPDQEHFHRLARHAYFACVSYIDAQIGRVMNELEALGLAENTIVVIWGDHGWHLGEHNFWGKHNTLDNASKVPLIIKVPGQKTGDRNQLVEFVDVYPTLCELVNLPVPQHCQGKSMAELFKNPKASHKDVIYPGFRHMSAVKTNDFLYTQFFENDWTFESPILERMMFDHRVDKAENNNISEDEDYKKDVEKMSKLLEEHLKEIVHKTKIK